MQLSHLNAIISEWPVSNGTRHEAQRIYPAARVASTVGRSSSFAEGAWRRSKEGPLRYCIPVLQLCIPVIHLNTVDILLSSLFYFASLVLIEDPQRRPPATPKQEPRDANSSKRQEVRSTLGSLSIEADQVVITCFRIMSTTTKSSLDPTGVHKQKVADTVAYNSPLRASAALLGRMPALRPCDQPFDKEHRRARHNF